MPIPPGADQVDPDRSELRDRFESVEKAVDDSRITVHSASTLDDFDRSTIAHTVMYVYAGVMLFGFMLFAVRAWHATQDDWKSIMSDAGDLIKTAVLPIVTLVLGYYFGKSGKG